MDREGIGTLLDVDGKAIVRGDEFEEAAVDKPVMLVEGLGELIGNALVELEFAIMDLENVRDLLQSFDGIVIEES